MKSGNLIFNNGWHTSLSISLFLPQEAKKFYKITKILWRVIRNSTFPYPLHNLRNNLQILLTNLLTTNVSLLITIPIFLIALRTTPRQTMRLNREKRSWGRGSWVELRVWSNPNCFGKEYWMGWNTGRVWSLEVFIYVCFYRDIDLTDHRTK